MDFGLAATFESGAYTLVPTDRFAADDYKRKAIESFETMVEKKKDFLSHEFFLESVVFSRQESVVRLGYLNRSKRAGTDPRTALRSEIVLKSAKICDDALPKTKQFSNLLDHPTEEQIEHLARFELLPVRYLVPESSAFGKCYARKEKTFTRCKDDVENEPFEEYWRKIKATTKRLWPPPSPALTDTASRSPTSSGTLSLPTNKYHIDVNIDSTGEIPRTTITARSAESTITFHVTGLVHSFIVSDATSATNAASTIEGAEAEATPTTVSMLHIALPPTSKILSQPATPTTITLLTPTTTENDTPRDQSDDFLW